MASAPPLSPTPSRAGSVSHTIEKPSRNRNTAWSAAADTQLLAARASGLNWETIASRHFASKTANACRKRHERLIARRSVDSWNERARLGRLAREYLAVRKEMWEILGERVGEKWSVVEAKCMEHGLKTLANAARRADRRSSTATSVATEFDDSGLGMEEDEDEEEVIQAGRRVLVEVDTAATGEQVIVEQTVSICDESDKENWRVAALRRPILPRRSSSAPTIAFMLRSPSPSPERHVGFVRA